jgi:hypothetical protein
MSFTKHDLAEHIEDFLMGGEGYLLDCFMQEPSYSPELEPFATRLFSIHEEYSSKLYPVGLANPEARKHLVEVMTDLRDAPRPV